MTLVHPKTEIAEDQPGVEKAEMAMKVLVTSVTARNEASEDTEWTSLSGTLAQGFAPSV